MLDLKVRVQIHIACWVALVEYISHALSLSLSLPLALHRVSAMSCMPLLTDAIGYKSINSSSRNEDSTDSNI